MAISATPETFLLPGRLRRTILPKKRYGESLRVGESDTQLSNWEADTLPLSSAAPAKSSSPMPRCQVMLCAVGTLLRYQEYEEKH